MENLSNIEIGLLLMLVGMLTVFAILLIVVLVSKFLIFLTNKVEVTKSGKSLTGPSTVSIDKKKLAILTAVVSHATAGHGSIESVKKI